MKKPKYTSRICLLIVMFFFLCGASANAQKRVAGSVFDKDSGEPLSGTSVVIKGEMKGVFVGIDGKYSVVLRTEDAVLVFKHAGFKIAEVKVGTQREVNVYLIPEGIAETGISTALNFIQEKQGLSFSVQQLSNNELTSTVSPNWTNALAGRVVGLQLNTSGNVMGGSTRVTLRGETSQSAMKNGVLFVVDGIPVEASYNGFVYSSLDNGSYNPTDFGNALGDLNAEDIESVTVLKGPAATSLYGSRGMRGVIQINTKTGRPVQGVGVTWSSSMVVDQPIRFANYQTKYGQGEDGLTHSNQTNSSWGPEFLGQSVLQFPGTDPTPWRPYSQAQTSIFQPGFTLYNTVTAEGASRTTRARVSFGNTNLSGILPSMGFSKNNATAAIYHALSKDLVMEAKVQYVSRNDDNQPSLGYDQTTLPYFLINASSNQNPSWNIPTYTAFGDQVAQVRPGGNLLDNPEAISRSYVNRSARDAFNGIFSVTGTITSKIALGVRAGISYAYEEHQSQRPYDTYNFPRGMYFEQSLMAREMYGDLFAKFSDQYFSERLKFSLIAGLNMMENNKYNNETSADSLLMTGTYNFENSLAFPRVSSVRYNRRLTALYGSTQLSWDKLAYLDAGYRNDWSSTMYRGDNQQAYPSLGVSLMASEFFAKYNVKPTWMDEWKIRASWAEAGQEIEEYLINPKYIYSKAHDWYTLPDIQINPLLKPMRVRGMELGTEFSLFKGALVSELVYYHNRNYNYILLDYGAPSSGANLMYSNAGRIDDRGVEISLHATPIHKGSYSWRTMLAWSTNTSEVIDLGQSESLVMGKLDREIEILAVQGGRLGDIYGYKPQINNVGDYLHNAVGGIILSDTPERLGNIYADWKASWANDFRYSNWSFSLLLDSQFGGDIYSQTTQMMSYLGKLDNTISRSDPDAKAHYQSLYQRDNAANSLYDASFIKLREVKLEYAFPIAMIKNWFIQKMALGIWSRNLATITSFPGYDPEMAGIMNGYLMPGTDSGTLPTTRSIGMSLKIGF